MAVKRIAIIGAGPAGLTSAKAVLENGMEPKIFEAADSMGGLWRPDGYVWPGMRTNISRWNNCFSDYPWPETTDDFPTSRAVWNYLKGYAAAHKLDQHITFNSRVENIWHRGGRWQVKSYDGSRPSTEGFDGIIVASGVFGKPFIPKIKGLKDFRGEKLHSSQYRGSGSLDSKRVVIVGGSFSGIDIASDLADGGSNVIILMSRPMWILPRHMPQEGSGRHVPLDIALSRRRPAETMLDLANLKKAMFLEKTFGNPGRIHCELTVPVDEKPPYVAVSDRFLQHVKSGAIQPVRRKLESIRGSTLFLEDREISGEAIVLCTGYRNDVAFTTKAVQAKVGVRGTDRFLPLLADHAVAHPDVDGLCFVGAYRGPYFATMELQARWAAALLAGEDVLKPSLEGVRAEAAIRDLDPRPQFPHGDYISFSDSIARKIGALPQPTGDAAIDRTITDGPVTAAQYRLSGPGARPEIAIPAIRSALKRFEA